jgi:hypothetical protein
LDVLSLASALKAGNPNRIISYNSGIGSNTHTNQSDYDDYVPGESDHIASEPSAGRWANQAQGVQWFDWTFLGASPGWGFPGTSKPTSSLTGWVKQATDAGGAINLDAKVNRFGRIDTAQLDQLRQVDLAVRGTVDDASAAIAYTGSWLNHNPGGCYAASCHNASSAGVSAQYTFTGRRSPGTRSRAATKAPPTCTSTASWTPPST